MKKLLALLLAMAMVFACFASCGKKDDSTSDSAGNSTSAPDDSRPDDSTPDDTPDPSDYKAYADYTDMESYRAYLVHDLDAVKDAIGSVDSTVDAAVKTAYDEGVAAINKANSVTGAKDAYAKAAAKMADAVPAAEGLLNYSGLSAAEKTEILGKIEAYSIRNGMLGVSLFENGGYVMYNPRITLGSENYIVGYGFGVLAEGNIKEGQGLATENKEEWKMYYHTYDSNDPGTVNYLNSQGSQVGDFYGYMSASYYTNFMKDTKDGYDWVPELAVADPEPVGGLDANGQNDTWRFEIRSGLKYSTNSALADRAAFNNREVVAEDFLTPFKLLLNQANGYYRGGEMANQTGANSIKGANAYYNATKNSPKGIDDTVDFSGVGIKLVEEGGKTYFQFTLGAPVTMYYARYYISSSLYMPVPKDFIDLVGADAYLGYNTDKTTTPVDNSLSLGAYTLERWDTDQQVVYKKNQNYVYASTKYKIEGIHINILAALNSDTDAGIKEFLAGKVDSAGVTEKYLAQYASDPRTKTTTGDSVFKLNMNALNKEQWVKLFGVNGTYSQTTEDKYWDVKPELSNAHFRLGLSYALDRLSFGKAKGRVGAVNYFSSNYMSDPENGISYNATQQHKDAVKQLLDNTDGYGYNLELARDYFRVALDELEADGLIVPGTKENPTVISLEVAWFTAAMEESYHKYVKQYWETAFNDDSVTGGKYKLDIKFWCSSADDYMECYNKIMAGQFDIGFGSISGNPLDPLSFFNVNSTDPTIANNFTLNWAIDTNSVTEALVYGGKRWSFDGLYQSTQELSIIESGKLTKAVDFAKVEHEKKDDGSFEATIELKIHKLATDFNLDDLVIFGGSSSAYKEWSLDASMFTATYDEQTRVYTLKINLPASELAKVPVDDNQGFDVYFTYTLDGKVVKSYKTAHISFQ